MDNLKVGISGLTTYVPPYRVDLEQWCAWSDNSWDKIRNIVGSGFRVLGPNQTIYSMAANAVLDLIISHEVNPSEIGFLALGTESSTDNSAGSIIIKGMVNEELKNRNMDTISSRCEVPEFKQACLSGIYALKNAVRFIKSDAPTLKAIVVCSDIALYQIGTSGEPTQGAGAIAALVEKDPKIAEVRTELSGTSSDYRLLDFRKPIQYRAKQASDQSDFDIDLPIFNGKYSSSCYIDETIAAVDDMAKKRKIHTAEYLRNVSAAFLHRPFHKMPITAFSIVYLHALAHGNNCDKEELKGYAFASNISFKELLNELINRADVSEFPHKDLNADFLPLSNGVIKKIKNDDQFQNKILAKIEFGSLLAMEMGNIYSGSVFGWLAAGMEDAISRGIDWSNKEALLFGYGSGDAAEVIPLIFTNDWKEASIKTNFSGAFEDQYDLSHQQYLTLRSEKTTNGIDYQLRNQFIVKRIGTEERDDFQDAGIEYYEFLN
ncbi:MAG: hydroxymethylglutaryl-CoA synthase family protein [Gammaproteobacteria bacterium]|nr:hydroxymethylglutaryl-CoA synthase family protein [Gammaproteobacteria bacterium]